MFCGFEFSIPTVPAPLADLVPHWVGDNYALMLFSVLPFVAGLSLLAIRSKSKVPGILFVLAFVSFFPLGTILSFYMLFYLFVVTERDEKIETH